MSHIISFNYPYHFAVYEHKIQKRKELSVARIIVLKNQDNRIIAFTGLEAFSFPYTGQKPKISARQKAELIYICVALNHIFSGRKVQKLTDVTAKMIFDFFDDYCQFPKGRSEEIMRSQQSMDNCVRHVSSFFANLAKVFPMKYEPGDLMHYEETKAGRHSQRIVRRYIPRYQPKRPHSYDDKLLRDMPLAAAARLVQLATIHDPMIAFGIVLQLSAGLRPSCVTNMRREDSPVSTAPGISMSYIGSAVSGIKLDLTHEYVLRSDGVSVGRIKREREVVVYKEFIGEVVTAYRYHLQLLDNIPCEEQYKPMFVGRNGKAMTYNNYAKRVKRLVYTYLKPELYNSEDPMLSAFAHALDSRRWAPHTLRHCFTVRLVLEGLDVAQVQLYRGDSSPESAIAYVKSKGELKRQVRSAHQKAIEEMASLYKTTAWGTEKCK